MKLSPKVPKARRLRFAVLTAIAGGAALTTLSAAGVTVAASARPAAQPSAAAAVRIHPMLKSRFGSSTQPVSEEDCIAFLGVPCYGAPQFQAAYDEQPLFSHGINGAGSTIAIVDSFGSPTMQADLTTFDQEYGLPDPPSFQVIQPAGPVTFDPTNPDDTGWAGETTLDVEWAHAMAPGANILLVETPVSETEGTAGFPEIVQAENYVIDHHLADVISQSFGATEQTFPSPFSLLALRSAYVNAFVHGVTVLAATGDAGSTDDSDLNGDLYTHPAVIWPSTDPLVTAVGGTQLSLDDSGNRTAPDVVWNDSFNTDLNDVFFGNDGPNALGTGGGKSVVFRRPVYQLGVARTVGFQRGVPDISMSGACSGLVNTYQSFPGQDPGWYLVCGTSESTPLFAGIVALADQVAGHRLGLINPRLYLMSAFHAPGLVDITSGNNSTGFTQDGTQYSVPGFSAGPGYDLASGVGTVDAARFVPELAGGH